jgi:hypothetical protein
MVGTSAMVAFRIRRRSRARCNAGIVRAIMGLRDIGARSVGLGEGQFRPCGDTDPIKTDASSPSGLVDDPAAVDAGARFMIKTAEQRFEAVAAHFT